MVLDPEPSQRCQKQEGQHPTFSHRVIRILSTRSFNTKKVSGVALDTLVVAPRWANQHWLLNGDLRALPNLVSNHEILQSFDYPPKLRSHQTAFHLFKLFPGQHGEPQGEGRGSGANEDASN
jgi:hypothetical protein